MKSEKVKEMLDSCYMAKRILDMLPKLPEGVLPSYVRYLETIIELEEKRLVGGKCHYRRLSTAHADHYPGHRGQQHPRGGQ